MKSHQVVRGDDPGDRGLACGRGMRVYARLTLARPGVAVLTDGSGRSGRSRLPATRETLEETACTAGPFFGAMTETPFYERHGESRVAAGKDSDVLRRREHVLPIAEALWRAC